MLSSFSFPESTHFPIIVPSLFEQKVAMRLKRGREQVSRTRCYAPIFRLRNLSPKFRKLERFLRCKKWRAHSTRIFIQKPSTDRTFPLPLSLFSDRVFDTLRQNSPVLSSRPGKINYCPPLVVSSFVEAFVFRGHACGKSNFPDTSCGAN